MLRRWLGVASYAATSTEKAKKKKSTSAGTGGAQTQCVAPTQSSQQNASAIAQVSDQEQEDGDADAALLADVKDDGRRVEKFHVFFMESGMSVAGVILPSKEYMQALYSLLQNEDERHGGTVMV